MDVPQKVIASVYGSKPGDWKQHENGGGWVYKTAKVDSSVYLHPTSIVYGNAQVYGNARVSGDARVYGNARVSGDAQVYGNAQVSGNARVSGDAQVSGNARVSGDARVYGDAWESSPLYIHGTRHALTLCSHNQIAAGCHVHSIAEWLKRYKVIGRSEGYSKNQIEEYGVYLNLLAATAKRLQPKSAKKKTATKKVADA